MPEKLFQMEQESKKEKDQRGGGLNCPQGEIYLERL